MKKIMFLFFVLISHIAQSQITVSTITPQIKGSGGITLDNSGNLYIADFGDFLNIADNDGIPNKILKLDNAQSLTDYASNFIGASGNTFYNGSLYQADIRANAIYQIVNGNKVLIPASGINQPIGIKFDSQGNLFVCNCGNNTIQKITALGTSTTFASNGSLLCPNGITIDENDNLYIANFSNGNIIKINPAGISTIISSVPGNSNGHLDYHEASRTLVIASLGSHKIYKLPIDDTANLQVIAGSGIRGNQDGNALSASFSTPNGVAISEDGNSIYVNSAIPLTGFNDLNPQVIRVITGVSLSIEESIIPNNDIKVYPNPVKDELIIDLNIIENIENLNVKLFNTSGKIVKDVNTKVETSKISVSISGLSSGMYLYTIYNKNKKLKTGKINKL